MKNLGGYTKSQFVEGLPKGKLDGGACVLCCGYLFACLLFFYLLFVCVFAFYLLLQSCLLGHASMMWFSVVGRGGEGVAISMELFGGFGGLALAYFVLQCA